jgi:hypothetical protein
VKLRVVIFSLELQLIVVAPRSMVSFIFMKKTLSGAFIFIPFLIMTTHKQRRLPFRSQWKMSVLVVWFLFWWLVEILLLGHWVFANEYQLVWEDDFTGSAFDTWRTEGYNGGTPPSPSSRSLSGWKAVRTANQWGNFSVLLRPELINNGKATNSFIKIESAITAPAI